MPGLIRGVARTAVVAGTATAVSNRVSRRQAGRWANDNQQQMYASQPTYAEPPPQYQQPQPVYVQQAPRLEAEPAANVPLARFLVSTGSRAQAAREYIAVAWSRLWYAWAWLLKSTRRPRATINHPHTVICPAGAATRM